MRKFLIILAFSALLLVGSLCVGNEKSMPSKKWLANRGVVNASNYTIVPMLPAYDHFAALGSGYASEMQGFASWGVGCVKKTGATLVAVWNLPKSPQRCNRNAWLLNSFYQFIDYTGECK